MKCKLEVLIDFVGVFLVSCLRILKNILGFDLFQNINITNSFIFLKHNQWHFLIRSSAGKNRHLARDFALGNDMLGSLARPECSSCVSNLFPIILMYF